jgi:hypothetical protein
MRLKALTGLKRGIRFGREQTRSLMKLESNEIPYCPAEREDYLLILRQGQAPPQNQQELQALQEQLATRLQAEASPTELAWAGDLVKGNLSQEFWTLLPQKLFRDPATAACLIRLPAPQGTRLHEWKAEALEYLMSQPAMPEAEAMILAHHMTLEAWLINLL